MSTVCREFVQHDFRKECKICKRPEADHPFHPDVISFVRKALRLEHEPHLHPQRPEFVWSPRRCPLDRLDDFFISTPPEKIPITDTEGEKYWEKQWIIQIPKTALVAKYCRFMNDKQMAEYAAYIERRDDRHVDEAYVQVLNDDLPEHCIKCQKQIQFGELLVTAFRSGFESAWHPACFRCVTCGEQPIDFIHCVDKNTRVFCIRHFDEEFKPRCDCCDELILDGDYSKDLNKSWHTDHFRCFHCDVSLVESRYFPKNLKPYCQSCYEHFFCYSCSKCLKRIGVNEEGFRSQNTHWHAKCFTCDDCSASLKEKAFGRNKGKTYCADCYNEKHAEQCSKCGESFKVDTPRVEYEELIFHKDCFICCKCEKPIQENTFIPENEKFYCVNCYKEHLATPCAHCNELVVSNGVAIKGITYHKQCLTCENCKKSLDDKILTKNDKPYCSKCYDELFAKKCAVCKGLIMAETKYMEFENSFWHLGCLHCLYCNEDLVGQTFLTTDDGVICHTCAEKTGIAAHAKT